MTEKEYNEFREFIRQEELYEMTYHPEEYEIRRQVRVFENMKYEEEQRAKYYKEHNIPPAIMI